MRGLIWIKKVDFEKQQQTIKQDAKLPSPKSERKITMRGYFSLIPL